MWAWTGSCAAHASAPLLLLHWGCLHFFFAVLLVPSHFLCALRTTTIAPRATRVVIVTPVGTTFGWSRDFRRQAVAHHMPWNPPYPRQTLLKLTPLACCPDAARHPSHAHLHQLAMTWHYFYMLRYPNFLIVCPTRDWVSSAVWHPWEILLCTFFFFNVTPFIGDSWGRWASRSSKPHTNIWAESFYFSHIGRCDGITTSVSIDPRSFKLRY